MTELKIFCLVTIVAAACFAQSSDQYKRCIGKAETQASMNACANEESRAADITLNEIYQKLLALVGSESPAAEKIRIAENAWIAFRDSYIDAMYPAKDKLAEYGSSFLMQASLLRAKLTGQQIIALKELLKQHGDPQSH